MTELAQNSAMLMKLKIQAKNHAMSKFFFSLKIIFPALMFKIQYKTLLNSHPYTRQKNGIQRKLACNELFFSFLFSETFEFLFFFSGEYVCFSVFDTKPSYFVCGGDSYLRNLWGNLLVNKRNPLSKMQIIPFEINQEAPALLFRKK